MQISKVHHTFQVTQVQIHANLKSTSNISSHKSTKTCKSQKYIIHFKSQVPRHANLKGTSYISSHKYKDMQISQEHHIDNSQVYIQASSIVYFQLVYIRLWCTSLLLKPCTFENLCVHQVLVLNPCTFENLHIHQALVYIILVERKVVLYFVAGVQESSF